MRLKQQRSSSAGKRRRRLAWGIWLLALLPVLWFSYDRMIVLSTGSVYDARILDCSGSWVRRSSGSGRPGRLQLRHTPVAYTETGLKAVGGILLSHEWCLRQLGSKVAVATAEGTEPRLISFIQYWLALSLGWYIAGIWLLALLGTRAPLLVTFNVGYLASAVVLAYVELYPATAPDKADDPSATVLALCTERELHDQQVNDAAALQSFRCQNPYVSDLASLPSLDTVTALYLQGSSLESLESAPALPSLRTLSVAGSDTLVSLKGIERLPGLTELQANQSAVSDLAGVEALTQLRVVAFMRNRLDSDDVAVFANLDALEDVVLNYNDIADISAFANKPKLREFQVYGNRVRDVSPLYGNTALTLAGVRGRGNVPCEQILMLRSKLAADARVFGPKACD